MQPLRTATYTYSRGHETPPYVQTTPSVRGRFGRRPTSGGRGRSGRNQRRIGRPPACQRASVSAACARRPSKRRPTASGRRRHPPGLPGPAERRHETGADGFPLSALKAVGSAGCVGRTCGDRRSWCAWNCGPGGAEAAGAVAPSRGRRSGSCSPPAAGCVSRPSLRSGANTGTGVRLAFCRGPLSTLPPGGRWLARVRRGRAGAGQCVPRAAERELWASAGEAPADEREDLLLEAYEIAAALIAAQLSAFSSQLSALNLP